MTASATDLPVGDQPGRCGCSELAGEAAASCFCTVDHLVSAIARKHALSILNVLGGRGPARFTDLQDALSGVSSSTLSDTLRDLTDVGLVSREVFAERPPRVEYRLTESGELLRSRFRELLGRVRGGERDVGEASSEG